MKDNFSSKSDEYAKYRPNYPSNFFDFLNATIKNKECVWDCGTGNGQIAYQLANTFNTVFATDISQSQIDNAKKAANIVYSVQPAEKTNFSTHQFDLVIVAQAIHWFDFTKFYKEVRRTAKKDALICVVGYGQIEISEEIDAIISTFFHSKLGKFWDKERRYIDENYQTIPFPFEEMETPTFVNTYQWSLDHLIGYLNTWSAVKHYISKNKNNPVHEVHQEIQQYWGKNELKAVNFPILLRMGKIVP